MNILHEIIGPQLNPRPIPDGRTLKTIEFDWDRGGWNNVILAVEVMICLALRYNRALVMPQSSKWYLLDGDTHLFDFYDEDTFKSFVPTCTLPQGGSRWKPQGKLISNEGKVNLAEIESFCDANSWYFSNDTRMLSNFAVAFPSAKQFYATIRSALRIKTDLIEMAINVLKQNDLRLGEFIALHVRRNDFQYKKVVSRSNQDIVDFVLAHIGETLPVLILSDVFDSDLIKRFESRGHRVVCWSQRMDDAEKFSNRSGVFVKTTSKKSIVIDMICATPAKKFFGSPLSTFSSRICHWRGLLSTRSFLIDDGIYYTMPWKANAMYWNYVDSNYWK